MFVLRWGIAVAGIWWVISQMTLRDHVTIFNDDYPWPTQATLARPANDKSTAFVIHDPRSGEQKTLRRNETVNLPDRKTVELADGTRASLLALDLSEDLRRVNRLIIVDPQDHERAKAIPPSELAATYQIEVPHPRVEAGVINMLSTADQKLIWVSMLIFPIVFVITSARWNALLRVLGIRLTQARTFVLNMVGCFYNTFMLGSTGGDVFKAYYAARQTPRKTHAVLSVVIDRAIGLLALVILGGTMAAVQYLAAANRHDPATVACRRIALGSAAILGITLLGIALLAQSGVRRILGIDFILARLPMQKQVQHGVQVMRAYRDKPLPVLMALLVTFPVHITVVLSAMFAGKALGLPLPAAYYFVAVPVIVLGGALPISPQGAGVMEFLAIHLTRQYGTTVSQAFALTMAIRIVQILWNLTGGIFVVRGGYHAPTQQEKEELEREEAAEAATA